MAEAEAADATGLEGAGSEICYYEKKHDRKMVRSGMIGTCEGVTYTSEDAGFLGGEEDPCWDAYCGEEQIRLLNEPFRDCKYLEPGEKAAVFSLSVFEKTKEAFYLVLYTENYVILEDGQEPVSVNTFLLRMENDGSTEVLDARFSS
ncbi:MAG: hypothetical protein IJ468_14220 [Lachnospiraceae bacterium]|nr:hypothetical protein [Lachnospiraceae bacterium]